MWYLNELELIKMEKLLIKKNECCKGEQGYSRKRIFTNLKEVGSKVDVQFGIEQISWMTRKVLRIKLKEDRSI